jgi:hypothetical protein
MLFVVAVLAQFVNHATAASHLLEAEYKTSLILVDRTLDLAGPAMRGLECVADRYHAISEFSEVLTRLHPESKLILTTKPPSYPSIARITLPPRDSIPEDSLRLYTMLLKRPKEALVGTLPIWPSSMTFRHHEPGLISGGFNPSCQEGTCGCCSIGRC